MGAVSPAPSPARLAQHATDDELEQYAAGRLPEPARLEEHLLVCEPCRLRLSELDAFLAATRGAALELLEVPLDLTHLTEDGPIRLLVEPAGSGGWRASFAGQQLEGARPFSTVAEANNYVLESFRLMFPGHECSERCH